MKVYRENTTSPPRIRYCLNLGAKYTMELNVRIYLTRNKGSKNIEVHLTKVSLIFVALEFDVGSA